MTSRLASLLVQEGRISAKRMAEAFQRQAIFGGALDTTLLEMGLVDEAAVLEYLGRAAGMPFTGEVPSGEPGSGVAEAIERGFTAALAEQFQSVPLGSDGPKVRVMVLDPGDRAAIAELSAALGRPVDPRVGPEYRYHQAMESLFGVAMPERHAKLARKLGDRLRTATPAAPPVAAPSPIAPQVVPPPVAAPPVPTPVPPATGSSGRPPVAPPSAPREPVAPQPSGRTARADDFVFPRDTLEAIAPRDEEIVPLEDPVPTLSLENGLAALQAAEDRDGVFQALCLVARARFEFVALFSVQGEVAHARMAIGSGWVERERLAEATCDLTAPSPLRVAVQTAAPFMGRAGEDPETGGILRVLGRPAPLPAALVPVVLRERVVAVLHVDHGGRVVAAEELAGVIQVAAEATQAFLRLIQASKKGTGARPSGEMAVVKEVAFEASSPTPVGPPPVAPPSVAPPLAAPSAVAPPAAAPPAVAPPAIAAVASPPVAPSVVAPPPVAPPPVADRVAEAGLLAGSAPQAVSAPEAPAPQPLGGQPMDLLSLLAALERDQGGPEITAALLSQGAEAANAIVSRFPGPLRFGHRRLNTVNVPLAEHGPIVALAPRFGAIVVPMLLPRLADPTPDVRFYTALALAELRPEQAVAPLGQHVFDPDAAVRRAAAAALSRFPPSAPLRAFLDALRNELASPDLGRQRHATAALGELRDALSVPRLIDLLKHRDVEIVDLAHRALILVTKQDFGTTRWRWRSWWEKYREQSRLDWLLSGLEQLSAEARRSAAEELSVILTDRYGSHGGFARRDREEASRRWTAWYRLNPDALSDERREWSAT